MPVIAFGNCGMTFRPYSVAGDGMDIIRDVQNMTTAKGIVSGRVVGFANGMVRVSTCRGLVEAQPGPHLSVGDEVTINNGIAIRRNRGSPQVFQV